jgi:hypothetical protein
MQLFQADGYLYLGTIDFGQGATLMRSNNPDDPTSWQLITDDGFKTELGTQAVTPSRVGFIPGVSGNFYIWSAAAVPNGSGGDTIYVGTFNGVDGKGQVLVSTDGLHFSIYNGNGFGDANMYGIRSMDVVDGNLYIGGASNGFLAGTSGFLAGTALQSLVGHPYVV